MSRTLLEQWNEAGCQVDATYDIRYSRSLNSQEVIRITFNTAGLSCTYTPPERTGLHAVINDRQTPNSPVIQAGFLEKLRDITLAELWQENFDPALLGEEEYYLSTLMKRCGEAVCNFRDFARYVLDERKHNANPLII